MIYGLYGLNDTPRRGSALLAESFKGTVGIVMSEKSVSKFFGRTHRKTLLVLLAGVAFAGTTGIGPSGVHAAYAEDAGAIKPSSPGQTLPNFVNLVKQVKPAVVSITSMIKADAVEGEGGGMGGMGGGMGGMPFPFPFPFQMAPQQSRQQIEARGSGFLISADGYVVTNNHVVKGPPRSLSRWMMAPRCLQKSSAGMARRIWLF